MGTSYVAHWDSGLGFGVQVWELMKLQGPCVTSWHKASLPVGRLAQLCRAEITVALMGTQWPSDKDKGSADEALLVPAVLLLQLQKLCRLCP